MEGGGGGGGGLMTEALTHISINGARVHRCEVMERILFVCLLLSSFAGSFSSWFVYQG